MLFFILFERYQDAGKELIDNQILINSAMKFKDKDRSVIASEGGNYKIILSKESQSAGIRQPIKDVKPGSLFRLSANIKTENVSKGPKPWNMGRLLFVSRNDKGKNLWTFPHRVIYLDGSNDWENYSKVFMVYEGVKDVVVSAEMSKSRGVMSIKNISLIEVKERKIYGYVRDMFLCLWAALSLATIAVIKRGSAARVHFKTAVILCGVTIIIAVTLPSETVSKVMKYSQKQFESFSASVDSLQRENVETIINKSNSFQIYDWSLGFWISHFVMFCMLALTVYWTWPMESGVKLFLFMMFFAAIAESSQYFTDQRTANIDDFLINILGIVVAAIIIKLGRLCIGNTVEEA